MVDGLGERGTTLWKAREPRGLAPETSAKLIDGILVSLVNNRGLDEQTLSKIASAKSPTNYSGSSISTSGEKMVPGTKRKPAFS
jgi:hypothetical protein